MIYSLTMLTTQPEVPQLAKPEVINLTKTSETSPSEVKTSTSPTTSVESKTLQPVKMGAKAPHSVEESSSPSSEKLVILGSGLAGTSAAVAACSLNTLPLLITGPILGGALASPGNIDFWPGAALNAKSSDLAAALHAQAARLGTKFMFDSVQSIDTTSYPYTISTKLGGLLSASAIIVATGLTPKTLNLKDEVSLLGRSIFTSAATINGPHKDAAVVGDNCAAANEALTLSTMVSQVTLVCGASQLICPPSLVTKLSQTANIRVEYNALVSSYSTDESDGGLLLWGLTLKRSDEVFTINATVTVLALGFEPKVDLLPPEAKTVEGFIKADLTHLNLKGLFAAGSIVESIPDQQVMISASGFTAATNAIHYLSSVEASAASEVVEQQPAAVPAEDKTKLAEAKLKAPASVPLPQAKADTTSEPASAGKTPSAEASSVRLFLPAPTNTAPSLKRSASTKSKLKLPKVRSKRTSPPRVIYLPSA
ncbi:MAG: NAD(P)/FAD-dependent oxidoreductase [Candidatus Hodgkinia cicadicola]